MKDDLRYWNGWSLLAGALVMALMLPAFAGVDGDWTLSGNTLTGVEKLGATNSVPLLFVINNKRVLEISPATAGTNTPKIRAGHPSNTATADGATVSGGGYATYPNQATQLYATVAGGAGNTASGQQSTVSGGYRNTASGERAAIGGGVLNTASGLRSTVSGGSYNAATADYTTVAGGGPADVGNPTTTNNKATDTYCTVGGGGNNLAGDNDPTPDNASGATVGGGAHNQAYLSFTTIGGGFNNLVSGPYSTAAGGRSNQVNGMNATIGGGRNNRTYGDYATIAGGGSDPTDGNDGWNTNNEATDDYCVIGGGYDNQAGDGEASTTNTPYATVAGGRNNLASADSATVGGGWWNEATAPFATVSGGGADILLEKAGEKDSWLPNRATDKYCTVGGGGANLAGNYNQNPEDANYATVAGGGYNIADHFSAAVGGGYVNYATGNYATIPGGAGNQATGQYSYAAGRNARSTADGAFTWADSTGSTLTNSTTDRFLVRASGGVFFQTNSTGTTGVYVGAGGTGWFAISDRNAKENFTEVKPTDVLDKVAGLPISTWNLKDDEAKVRHMGPMAQDLHAAFGLGGTDKAINSVDADGIALAAIQGLNQRVKDQQSEIQALRNELAAMKALVTKSLAR